MDEQSIGHPSGHNMRSVKNIYSLRKYWNEERNTLGEQHWQLEQQQQESAERDPPPRKQG